MTAFYLPRTARANDDVHAWDKRHCDKRNLLYKRTAKIRQSMRKEERTDTRTNKVKVPMFGTLVLSLYKHVPNSEHFYYFGF